MRVLPFLFLLLSRHLFPPPVLPNQVGRASKNYEHQNEDNNYIYWHDNLLLTALRPNETEAGISVDNLTDRNEAVSAGFRGAERLRHDPYGTNVAADNAEIGFCIAL